MSTRTSREESEPPLHGYVYVDRELWPSVARHGYMSVRARLKRGLVTRKQLAVTYGQQHQRARRVTFPPWPARGETDAAFEARRDAGEVAPEDLVEYLDWRDEHTLRGASAVYFLYAPVPDDARVRAALRHTRGFVLDDKVLVRFNLTGMGLTEYVVNPEVPQPPAGYRSLSAAAWTNVYRAALHEDTGSRCPLWFEGVPHAYVVPVDGIIPPDRLKRVNP